MWPDFICVHKGVLEVGERTKREGTRLEGLRDLHEIVFDTGNLSTLRNHVKPGLHAHANAAGLATVKESLTSLTNLMYYNIIERKVGLNSSLISLWYFTTNKRSTLCYPFGIKNNFNQFIRLLNTSLVFCLRYMLQQNHCDNISSSQTVSHAQPMLFYPPCSSNFSVQLPEVSWIPVLRIARRSPWLCFNVSLLFLKSLIHT